MATDLELLDAWRDGDASAADALIQRHFVSLCRFFRNKVDRGVDDLIQQTLVTCVERRDRFPQDWSFRTFLFVVARDQLYMHYRKRRRRGEFDPMETSVADLDPSPSTVAAQKAEQRLVIEGLRRLPMELQVLLELHYWEGLPGPELARVLALPEGTVRSRLRRARTLLADRVGELDQGKTPLPEGDDDFEAWIRDVKACVDAGQAGV